MKCPHHISSTDLLQILIWQSAMQPLREKASFAVEKPKEGANRI